jgi:hypothetical protein
LTSLTCSKIIVSPDLSLLGIIVQVQVCNFVAELCRELQKRAQLNIFVYIGS